MTDKELFEKTEKVFKLKKENNLLEKVYNDGKFKTMYENTSPIRSNVGASGVSAGRGIGRGIAATGRGALGAATAGGRGLAATGRGLGAVAKGAGSLISNLVGSGREKRLQQRMKRKQMAQDLKKSRQTLSADKRKAEAQARRAEIQAQQAQSNLMGGKDKNKQTKKPTDQERLKRYENDARYKRVWDAYAQGNERDVAASDIDYYNKIEDEINKGTIDKAAEEKAYQEIRNRAAANIDDIIKQKSPETYKQLIAKKQNDNFIKFMLGDELSQEDLKKIAFTISEIIKHNQTELTFIRDEIEKNRKLTPGDIKLFLKDLPLKATKETDPDEALKQTLKDISKQEGIPYKDLILKLNKEAEKFKIDDIVLGSAGAKHEVTDKDSKTGTVIVRSLKGKKLTKRFAKDLRLQQKSLDIDNSNEESFEQIVKRYR